MSKIKKPKNWKNKKLTKEEKAETDRAYKEGRILAEEIELKDCTKEQLLYCLKCNELLLQKQQRIIDNLHATTAFQLKHIVDLKKGNEMIVNKYEDQYQEYEKANEELKKENTQLTLNVEDLKERLFGKLTMRLKDFALRPDKKKDN